MTARQGCRTMLYAAALLAAFPCPASAQTASLIAQTRLFTTPAERRHLDAERRGAGTQRPGAPRRAELATTPAPLTVKGIVVRSDGSAIVWVDDGNTLGGNRLGGGLRARAGDGVAHLDVPGQRTVTLRPGQTYDPASGEISGIVVRKQP